MFTITNRILDHGLNAIYRGIVSNIIDIKDEVHEAFERLFSKRNVDTSVREKLAMGDRREPAYVQLRDVWETLDSISQKEAIGWILQKTMTDPLSGLETLVAREVSGKKPASWVEAISDLNALKAVNDTWGHEAGDTLIHELGKIVKTEVAQRGGRAFRVGGDEISYWFPDMEEIGRASCRERV